MSIFDCRFFSNHYFSALPPSWMFDALNNLIFFFLWQLVKFNYATTSILDHHPQSIIPLSTFFFSHNGIWWSKWIPPLSLKHLSHFNLFPFLSRKEIANHFLYLTSSIAPNLMLLQFYIFFFQETLSNAFNHKALLLYICQIMLCLYSFLAEKCLLYKPFSAKKEYILNILYNCCRLRRKKRAAQLYWLLFVQQ